MTDYQTPFLESKVRALEAECEKLRMEVGAFHQWLCGVNAGATGSLAWTLRNEAIKRVNRILASQPDASPADTELQRLLDDYRRINDGMDSATTRLICAMARKLGAE